jgi:hypothetical protein
MADYEKPEVLRVALESTCLRMKMYGFPSIPTVFQQFLDPPPTSRITAAIERLRSCRALDELEQLTMLGRFMARLPLDVELGKLVAYGAFYGCLDTAVTVASYLSASVNIFTDSTWSSTGSSETAPFGVVPRRFVYGQSDLLSYVNVYRSWKKRSGTSNPRMVLDYCKSHGLDSKALSILDDTRTQLVGLLRSVLTWSDCNRYDNNLNMIHAALVSASLPGVMSLQQGKLSSIRGDIQLHSSSIYGRDLTNSMSEVALVSKNNAMALLPQAGDENTGLCWSSPWFCYFSCLQTSKALSVYDATNIHPLQFALSVGTYPPLSVNYLGRWMALDHDPNLARSRIPPKTAAHLVEFHRILVCKLLRWSRLL